MALDFRSLRADEVECRVQSVKKNGLILLLYKDARVDQKILDETVGPMNWQRHHSRDNANCIVSIWDDDKNQWVEKEDTGVESNTQAEKGLASDSFKRACFNWGIGRELYTAPFTWIPIEKCTVNNGKCYDNFKVTRMEIENGTITQLEIVNNSRKGEVVFTYGSHGYQKPAEQTEPIAVTDVNSKPITNVDVRVITNMIKKKGKTNNSVLQYYKLTKFEEMTFGQWQDAMKLLEKYPDKE